MPRPPKRQPRTPISISLLHPDWVRTQRAAGMQNQTLSEYCREVIRTNNARLLDKPSGDEVAGAVPRGRALRVS